MRIVIVFLSLGYLQTYAHANADLVCRHIIAPPHYEANCAEEADETTRAHFARKGIRFGDYEDITSAPYYVCTTWVASYQNCVDPIEGADAILPPPGASHPPGAGCPGGRVYCP